MAAINVECVDFLEFQDTLKKMRQFDDKIIYKLNETIPTESFKGQVNLSLKCERLFEEVQNSHMQRESAINKCLVAAKERVKYLKNQKDSHGDDPIFIKNLRKEQTNLRLLQSELSVEEVLKNRTMNAFHDKCRGYYKPTNLSS
ncbi:protein MIX23 isoform X1 [Polistes fuscatus]|uniref:protein MIX23 isoform X1 n=2 Tax=Polistes fuscatus TaxID=30207 RepID=UPI001CA9C408|nr:protein MIX23 isoform X1 [Polistes fuscatus]